MKWFQKILYFFCVRCRPGRAHTITYTFSALVLVSSVVLIAAVMSSGNSYIKLTSDKSSILAGDTFSIKIYANASVPVNAINISLAYPSKQVKVMQIDTGTSVITIWTTPPAAKNGSIVLSGGTFRKGFLGEHLIASVDFEAIVDGQALFSLNNVTFLAGDGAGSDVPVSSNDTQLVVAVKSENGALKAAANVVIISDVNGDGKVTMSDMQDFMKAWGGTSAVYDFNNDSKVNFTDFAIILANVFLN